MGKAERTRQFIIETAAPIFNEKGIAGTTIDDILSATKMAKGGLYGHFSSKEDIACAMVDFLLNKMSEKITAVTAKEKTAMKKLYAFIDVYKDPLNPYIDGGCPIMNFGVESDDTNPVIRQKVKTVIEKGQTRLRGIISQGIEDKEFAPDVNAEELAIKMFATVQGGMMITRVTGNKKYMQTLCESLKNDLKTYLL